MSPTVHMVRIPARRSALWRATFGAQGRAPLRDADEGYLVHAGLRKLFGADGPQPFAIDPDRGPDAERGDSLEVFGYAAVDADGLRASAAAGEQRYAQAFDLDGMASKELPVFAANRRLTVQARCVASRRANEAGAIDLGGRRQSEWRKGDELDAFVLACARHDPTGAGTAELHREEVYAAWFAERLVAHGAELLDVGRPIRVHAWRRVRLFRRPPTEDGGRAGRAVELPEVYVEADIRVAEPAQFHQLLATGIGKHRAFGYGMLLLRPYRD